jgi:hypothetical protein
VAPPVFGDCPTYVYGGSGLKATPTFSVGWNVWRVLPGDRRAFRGSVAKTQPMDPMDGPDGGVASRGAD